MLEKQVEARLKKGIESLGGIAYKFTSPQRRSVPDRLCLLPGGRVFFVECKRPGGVPTDAQEREMERIRTLGFSVYVVSSYGSVDTLISCLEDDDADNR